jgi:AraC-like DNA-binding protein
MLKNIPLTRAAGMGPLPEILEESGGFDLVQWVFTRAGLPTILIDERHHWVPLSFLADLFLHGSKITSDPLLGLRVGHRMAPEQFGLWAIYGLQAPTPRDMISRLERALTIHTQGVRFALSPRRDGLVAWEYTHAEIASARFIQHGDHLVPVMLKALRQYVGSGMDQVEIRMPYQCSRREAAAREYMTSLPWSFGHDSLAVVFPESVLAVKGAAAKASSSPPDLEAQVEELVRKSRSELEDIALRVEVIMLLRLMDQNSDIGGLARILSLSPRSLQRGLAGLGVSYRRLLSKVRMQRALELLETSDASLTEIALDLDYSDLAHFTRAFKQHFGHPPSLSFALRRRTARRAGDHGHGRASRPHPALQRPL